MAVTLPVLEVSVDFDGNPTAQFAEILGNHPDVVSFWRMNSTSTFLDSVGPNDGSIVGTPTLATGPHLVDADQALAFDGSADGATVPHDSTLTPNKGAFSVEGWLLVPSFPGGTRDLVSKRGSWILSLTSAGKLQWTVKDDTSIATVETDGPLVTGGFYYVAAVYTGSEIRLYVNGILAASTAYSSGWETGTQPIRFAITPSTTAPTYQTNSQANGATGTVTITKPTGTASGDLLIAHITHEANDNLTALPENWALWFHNTTHETAGIETWVFAKVAGGSEPASYTWTITGSVITWTGAISRISGVGADLLANPIWFDAKTGGFTDLSTGTHLPNLDNCMILGLFSQQGTGAISEDSGTEQYDFGTNFRIALCSQTQTTATAIQITGTISPADDFCAIMIILPGTGSNFVACTLDDFGFWGRALSEVEAGTHHASKDAGPGTWTAITADVEEVTSAGAKRQHELGEMASGSTDLLLLDTDRDYDPANAASPLAPNVIPSRRLRTRATHSAVTYPLSLIFIDHWVPQVMVDPYQGIDVAGPDGFDMLGRARVDGALAIAFSGAQVNRLLDYALWPQADRAIDTGQYVMAADAISGGYALPLIREVAASELGIFFIDRDGVATFHDAAHRGSAARSTTPQAVFSDRESGTDVVYLEIVPSADKGKLVNIWGVSPHASAFGAAEQLAADYTSVLQHGPHADTRQTRLILNSDALAQAKNLLNQTARPALRYETLTVRPSTDNEFTKCLGLRPSDRVTVKRGTDPNWVDGAIIRDYFVEGRTIALRGADWVFTFQLSPISSGNYAAVIVRDGPVSYWRMNSQT